jgi:hypothetical protein
MSSAAAGEQGAHAGYPQVDAFQQQHRKEQPGLVAHQHPAESRRAAACLRTGEDQCAGTDVRIGAFGVGVGVVAAVFVDPPAEGQPDEQVAVQEPEQVVGPAAGEDLPVAGVVTQERNLGERDRQESGDQQLIPGPAEQAEDDPARREQPDGDRDLRRVVAEPSA